MAPDQLYRDQASLLEPNIEFHVDPVKQFKLDKNQVITEAGKTHEYDVMVIATGSRMVTDETPGLAEGAEFFYTEASAVKMYRALREFQGGRVAVAVLVLVGAGSAVWVLVRATVAAARFSAWPPQ